MRKFGTVIVIATAFGGLSIGIALAGNSGDPSRVTTFAPPTFLAQNTDCTWAWTNNHPAAPTHPPADDPADNCYGGTQDGYADAIADGMQIQAYAWAKDTCTGSVSVARAAASAGNVVLTNTYCPPYCAPMITGDWKPQFKARVDVNSPASGTAHGHMKGDTNVLNCHVLVDGTVSISDSSGFSTVQIGPAGVPVTTGIGTGSGEIWPIDNSHDAKLISQETAVYSCTTDAAASADAYFFDWYAEAWVYVWDSKAGLDLHGNCPSVCTGFGYILYNWY